MRNRMQDIFLFGKSHVFESVRNQIRIASQSPAIPMIIQGDSGTGKTALAHEFHRTTGLPHDALRIIDGSLAEDPIRLNETLSKHMELKPGVVLLEELGDLPDRAQSVVATLLDVSHREPANNATHWVFTSRQACSNLLREGRLREDLYFRLGSLYVTLPGLSDRLHDIPTLVQHFINIFRNRGESMVAGAAPDVLKQLQSYSWPGNVRELEIAIQFACTVAHDSILQFSDLPPALQKHLRSESPVPPDPSNTRGKSLQQAVEDFERDFIVQALSRARGNMAQAARDIETTARILRYKVKQYGIDPKHPQGKKRD